MSNITLQSLKTRLIQRNYLDATYIDPIFLEDCHSIVQDIWSDIVYSRQGNKNWDIWLTDTVSSQDEYTRPNVTSMNVGADYIDSVSIAYSAETYTNSGNLKYVPCRYATTEEIKNWTRLLEEQSQDDPIYFYSDDSIFIAPDIRSGESGQNRLRLTGVRSVASGSWTISTTETDIKLPIFLFDSLYYGLVWKSSEHMRREDAVIMQKYTFYKSHKIDQIRKMNLESSELIDSPTYIDPILGAE